MGTTLQNGVYLPNEGERNCYAGLKTNWEILDQKVADVTALQQAVAGALHREIVESLPTTDIDPNTIYMILSGTSATENVYNEFMYVNNAWELIGTSATDLTNYYTKADVDGKLLLKANASDLTSHTGDTTIHVTANDKSKWNTVALIKQLRLVNAQVGSATTIAFANIDDTNGIKVGDKCMDLDGKLFEITAVDTTNQTVTVGSALIDLALDSNVVHTSGNETITGVKSFINYLLGKDLSGQTVDLNDCVDAYGGAIHYYYAVSNYKNISNKPENKPFILESKTVRYVSSVDYIYYQKLYTADYNVPLSIYTRYYRSGSSSWSNWVKDSDRFVTTDTDQSIIARKIFSVTPFIYNPDSSANTPNLFLKSAKAIKGDTSGSNSDNIKIPFTDRNDKLINYIQFRKTYNGSSDITLYCATFDSNNQDISSGLTFFKAVDGSSVLRSISDNDVSLGNNSYKFKDVRTYLINGLTPSSLSLPSDRSARVDISGYFTNTASGDTNAYTALANGWIYLSLSDVVTVHCFAQTSNNLSHYGQTFSRPSVGQLYCLFPIRSGDVFVTQWYTTTTVTVTNAYFIPCQGNI